MSSGLFLAGRFNLRDQIVSVLRHPEEFVRQAVGKRAESRRNNGSFGVFNREVNLVAVDRLIADNPAGCGELLKTRGQFGVLDLVDEGAFPGTLAFTMRSTQTRSIAHADRGDTPEICCASENASLASSGMASAAGIFVPIG